MMWSSSLPPPSTHHSPQPMVIPVTSLARPHSPKPSMTVQRDAQSKQLCSAASAGHTSLAASLIQYGADVNQVDEHGRTPVMLAVLGGHVETTVRLALAGADLSRRDQHGRTALELAVAASNRETSLALLLIATGKFTKPLQPILPPTILVQLEQWVLDKAGRNDKAAAAVMRQQRTWLVNSDASLKSESDRTELMRGLLAMCVWASKHGVNYLSDQIVFCFAHELPLSNPGNTALISRLEDSEGHNVMHAVVLAGQGQACRTLCAAITAAGTLSLLRKRNGAGLLPSELQASDTHSSLTAASAAAASEASRLLNELSSAEARASFGGAVRRKRSSDNVPDSWPSSDTEGALSPSRLSDGEKAIAAGDLLHLASVASVASVASSVPTSVPSNGPATVPTGGLMQSAITSRARGNGSASGRAREKPYERPKGRASRAEKSAPHPGADKDCWLPGGFWWKDEQTAMPPGRQPGELAGWAPLAGERAQQMLQDQKKALSEHEQQVQGIESRDDAVAYLQQLQQIPNEREGGTGSAITSTVDDSVIAHSTHWKELASWGGFRRHYKDGEGRGTADGDTMCVDSEPEFAPSAANAPAHAAAPASSIAPEEVQARLEAKRREVDEARRRLDDLLQAQLQLEKLLLPEN
ncbi:hypothetical protein AB1Y20_006276 [Prymnesium parvum]|uniref:Uncharacterized protein n=1 Tax=Prymnesium parvum TaxID=97485 RepID=A0AB34J481_PRYPA